MTRSSITPLRSALLNWYDRNRRHLPWRAQPGKSSDPYRVWLSEIMLQQTTVSSVLGYYQSFLERWPQVSDLAAANVDEVLHAWQGLGYYARARNLHRCAISIVEDFGGRFPEDEKTLKSLPGVGVYTSAAIAAIAFGQKAAPVDGNIARVLSRLYGEKRPVAETKKRIKSLAEGLMPQQRPGDFAQAMMDMGAMVCTPRNPKCPICPWTAWCVARRSPRCEDYPQIKKTKKKPHRFGVVFWLENENEAVLLRRREEKGLLGGMMEIPSTPWRKKPWKKEEAEALALTLGRNWKACPGAIGHVFTHFSLELKVIKGVCCGPVEGEWVAQDEFLDHALPTVMKKVIRHVLRKNGF
jgi:A/G-specific adenine glycosylase